MEKKNQGNYVEARNYTSLYGAVVGACWVISFYCYMGGLSYPFLGDLGLIIGIASIFVASNIIRWYHNEREELTFRRAWHMGFMLFLYATLITALGQYIYFQYLDQGLLAQTYEAIISTPEFQDILSGVTGQGDNQEAIQSTIDLLYTITPVEMTFQLLVYNLFLGLILSIPAALLGRRKRKIRK